jgi:hypothetical protein
MSLGVASILNLHLLNFCVYTGRSKRDSACWFSPSHIQGSDRMMTGMRKPSPETFCHIKTGLILDLGLCNQKSYTNCLVVACASNDPWAVYVHIIISLAVSNLKKLSEFVEKTHFFNCSNVYIQKKNTVLLYASKEIRVQVSKHRQSQISVHVLSPECRTKSWHKDS